MRVIWATRGYLWGFRFLRRGGLDDPLPEYEAAFAPLADQAEGWNRSGGKVALRLSDPLGRLDAAGRVITHDFVVFEPLAKNVESVDDGLRIIWPTVSDEYERIWQGGPDQQKSEGAPGGET